VNELADAVLAKVEMERKLSMVETILFIRYVMLGHFFK
jgi:hypothetical protein